METKEKIFMKAAEMFLEYGYDGTPMSKIAKELGISKAGLYHHYPDKESLLFAAIDYGYQKLSGPLLKETKKILDPEKQLVFFLRGYAEIMTIDPGSRLGIHEAGKLKPEHFNKIKKIWQTTFDIFRDAISEMQKSGKAKKINSTYAAFAAIGMCSWIFYWFDYSRQENAEELAETFVEIFLRGITQETDH